MFLQSSRYHDQEVADVVTKDGQSAKVVTLRRLPTIDGRLVAVKGNDRLDKIALRRYNDATMFWHIADANTELQANDLLSIKGNRVRIIKVPEK